MVDPRSILDFVEHHQLEPGDLVVLRQEHHRKMSDYTYKLYLHNKQHGIVVKMVGDGTSMLKTCALVQWPSPFRRVPISTALLRKVTYESETPKDAGRPPSQDSGGPEAQTETDRPSSEKSGDSR